MSVQEFSDSAKRGGRLSPRFRVMRLIENPMLLALFTESERHCFARNIDVHDDLYLRAFDCLW